MVGLTRKTTSIFQIFLARLVHILLYPHWSLLEACFLVPVLKPEVIIFLGKKAGKNTEFSLVHNDVPVRNQCWHNAQCGKANSNGADDEV